MTSVQVVLKNPLTMRVGLIVAALFLAPAVFLGLTSCAGARPRDLASVSQAVDANECAAEIRPSRRKSATPPIPANRSRAQIKIPRAETAGMASTLCAAHSYVAGSATGGFLRLYLFASSPASSS